MKKIKLFLILCLLSSLSYGEGPLFSHKDPIVQQEFENIYQNLRSVLTLNSSSKCIDDPTFCVDVVGDDVSLADGTLVAHSDGWVLQATQPSFLVWLDGDLSNVTGDGTIYQVVYDMEDYDIGGNHNLTTFTSPVDGKYQLSASLYITGLDNTYELVWIRITTSNHHYYYYRYDIGGLTLSDNMTLPVTVFASMDANDTASIHVSVETGNKTIGIAGGNSTSLNGFFSGSLIN